MLLPHFRLFSVLLVTAIGISVIAIFTLCPPDHSRVVRGPSTLNKVSLNLAKHRKPKFKKKPKPISEVEPKLIFEEEPQPTFKEESEPVYAFITFLEEFSGANKDNDSGDGEEDAYYTATRVLGYQLMHARTTRTTTSIPFVVLCSEVSERKRRQLQTDGALVVEVEKIPDPEWLHTREQWQGVMTKLRIFQQFQFFKILYLDADMLIVRPLDDIFSDHGTSIQSIPTNVTSRPDEARLPPSYMLAGQAQQRSRVHPYPPRPNDDWFCSGFFVFQPSQNMFDYYMSIMKISNRFDPFYPDQNLLNYAHRWDGPMPWTKFNYTWTTTFPTWEEYEMGAASLHEKYWLEEFRAEEFGQDKLGKMWLEAKAAMVEYYLRRDGDKGGSVGGIEKGDTVF